MIQSTQVFVYIGTNTNQGSEGIYLSHLDLATGHLSAPELVAKLGNPAFLTTDPQQRFLYCTGKEETSVNLEAKAVSVFAIDRAKGSLTYLNSAHLEETVFCHIRTDWRGQALLAADYHQASIASFPLDVDGKLQPAVSFIHHKGYTQVNPTRQDVPHLHSINIDRSNRYAFVCDFSADEVTIYRFEAQNQGLTALNMVKTTPGAGPRHLTTHPNGQWVYVINELNSTITVYKFDADEANLTEIQTVSTLPPDFQGQNTTAEIVISPDLKFLYGSNRGHDSIAHYRLDEQTGTLTFGGRTSTEGEHPRNFTIDPSGQFLLVSNRETDKVVVFRLDSVTGTPIPTGQQIQLSMPMCIKIVDHNVSFTGDNHA